MKRTLLIIGHPKPGSLSHQLAEILQEKDNTKTIDLAQIKFDPILHGGYSKKQELEPDLIDAQEKIKWANHIILLFPIWWGSMPAILKGFFDRTFLPGFAFKKKPSGKYEKLLKGKTSHLIVTSGGSEFLYKYTPAKLVVSLIKKVILGFCGIKVKKIFILGNAEKCTYEKLQSFQSKIKKYQ